MPNHEYRINARRPLELDGHLAADYDAFCEEVDAVLERPEGRENLFKPLSLGEAMFSRGIAVHFSLQALHLQADEPERMMDQQERLDMAARATMFARITHNIAEGAEDGTPLFVIPPGHPASMNRQTMQIVKDAALVAPELEAANPYVERYLIDYEVSLDPNGLYVSYAKMAGRIALAAPEILERRAELEQELDAFSGLEDLTEHVDTYYPHPDEQG